ncbi:MAG: DNA repair exonuclease [candidate division Zixibacteria bacterium]|nr:DNA repair exonuclease [candidate division Zixibacteria bacterium]
MPQIIHTADIHLGMKFSGLGRTGKLLRTHLKNAFSSIVDITIEKNADCLVIAGDLFDSNQISDSTVNFVIGEITRLQTIPVIIIPGTHDPSSNPIWRSFKEKELPANLHLILSDEHIPLTFSEIDTTFWVKPNQESNLLESPIPELKDKSLSKYHIAIAHGSLAVPGIESQDGYTFQHEEISQAGFDYVALGHWHSVKQLNELNAYYCGTPEQSRFGLKDCGKILSVDVNDSGVNIEQIQTGKTQWHDLTLSTEVMKSPGDIIKELGTYTGDTSLVRCVIEGGQIHGVNFDADILKDELEEGFAYIGITDKTIADDIKMLLANYTAVTITGQFVQVMTERIENASPDMKDILEESLKLGCRLLIGNKSDKQL